jgi:hypothetical protein
MHRKLVVLLALALPALASAQYRGGRSPRGEWGPPVYGPSFSAWLGLGVPGGDISHEGDGKLGDLVNSAVPIGVEFAYRFNPVFRGGVYLQAAPLSVAGSACANGDSCDGSDLQFGFDAQLHLAPFQRIDPWVGLGLGYEWMRIDATNFVDNIPDRWTYAGWVFPRLTAGLDFAVTPVFTLGPYLSYDVGRFTRVDQSSRGSFDIGSQAYHGWFGVGLRGTFNL